MCVEVYRKWLADSDKKPDYINRFVNQVTVNSKATCLGWAVEKGLCPPKQTLLDLSIGQLYVLWAQRNDVNENQRTFLSSCMQFTLEQTLPITRHPGPLTLKLLVNTMRQVCSKDISETLMGALLLDPKFKFSNMIRRWELEPSRSEYAICRAAILEYLDRRRDDVSAMLIQRIHPILEQIDPSGTHDVLLGDLRAGYVLLVESLKKKLNIHPGWLGSGEEDLLLRMEGWRPDYSTGSRPDDAKLDWYAALGTDGMNAHFADTFLLLVELSLRHEGDTFSLPKPITELTDTDKLYYTLFAPFDRLLTPNLVKFPSDKLRLVKEADILTDQVARLLCMGLFRVERMPNQGTSCLRLAPAAIQTLSQEPSVSPDDPSCLEEIWRSSQMLSILLKLLAELERKPQYASHIFDNGSELIAMLATAPPDPPSDAGIDEVSPTLTGALATLLSGGDGLPTLSEGTRKELLEVQVELQRKEQVLVAVDKLTAMLLSCHWDVIQAGPSPDSVESLQRIIDLYRMRPRTVTKAIATLWKTRALSDRDWERRSQIVAGDSILLCDLYSHSAADCLALAKDEAQSVSSRIFWAGRARSDGRCAAEMALRLHEGLMAFDARIFQARSLAMLAVLGADSGSVGGELFTDSIAPCAQAVLDCYKLLDEIIPEQGIALSDETGEVFEICLTNRRDSFSRVLSDLNSQLFSPSVTDALQKHTQLWEAIPRICTEQNHWRALAGIRLHVPADDAVEPTVSPIPAVWIPAPQKVQVFLPYFCSYLDSEITKRKQYQPSRIEAYLLKTILSMENIVLTTNQAVDNAIIRNLAHQPGFRQLLRTGHITVSFFWGYYSLCQFAAAKLLDKGFIWSSLPYGFNEDHAARHAASEYLSGRGAADSLPLAYREFIIRFREELTLLDENLPARSKAQAYQYPNAGRGSTSLAEKLDAFFLPRQGDPRLADLCRLHFLLLSPEADRTARKALVRSQYQKCLDGLKNGNLAFLPDMEGLCDPAVYQHGTHQRLALESYTDPSKHETLALMQTVLSNRHNEMLGALCTDHQHHIYSEAERLILPYDETTPINQGGCRRFQDTVTTTETGVCFGWDQAPEFLERSEAILRQRPSISPEELANKLVGNELDYTISTDGRALWLARGTVHTSQRQSLLVELHSHTGTIHLQTEGA